MTQSLKILGSLQFQPTETAPPATVPISINSAFSQRGGFDIAESAAAAPAAVPMGSITKPVMLYIEVTEGTLNISTNIAMAEGLKVSVDAIPAPADKAYLVLYCPAPQTQAFFFSSPGAVTARVWVFG